LGLSVSEFGHATQRRLTGQAGIPVLIVFGLPFLDGTPMHTEELGHFFGRMAVMETLDGQQATTLQFSRGSFASHARQNVHSNCQEQPIEKITA
jgi:hypothetical protein